MKWLGKEYIVEPRVTWKRILNGVNQQWLGAERILIELRLICENNT